MAAMTAMRWNPLIKATYTHLRNRGKPHKAALVACMRKMLIPLDAMLRHGEAWRVPAQRSTPDPIAA